MRLKAVLCDVLARIAYYWAAASPHIVDIELLSSTDYHDYPKKGHEVLQSRIYELDTESAQYDYILLGYGLCGKIMDGITSGRTPLVVPRTHDCIALFLGGSAAYERLMKDHPGTLCYVDAWLERSPSRLADNELQSIGFSAGFEEYVKKYGEENAKYLFEVANSWKKHYSQCLYIKNALVKQDFSAEVKEKATKENWEYKEIKGSPIFIKKMFSGEWSDRDFLIVDTYSEISQVADDRVIQCRKTSIAGSGQDGQ
ncbi:MAG: DUF1638 domain-containing protein [Veillonellales bacterium]